MKICQSHGSCVYAAPAVFQLDDDDVLTYDEKPAEALQGPVEEAVQVCPTQAIRLLGD